MEMPDAWSRFNNRPRLTAAICFAYAATTVVSLNTVLPREMNHRHYIGWAFLLLGLFMIGVGIVALRGRELLVRVQAVWAPWSTTKRIVVGLATYVGVSLFGHLSCGLYEVVLRRWADRYLPESIAWWCQ